MKRIIILFVTVVLMTNSYAQLTTRKSTATQWVENAVNSAFFLSRQSFQVRDKKTGELYGLNNKDEFGTEISLGIKVKNGYVLTDNAIRPWEYNDKFEKYKDGYTPVPYSSQYSEFADDMKYDSLDITESNINELLSSTLYLVTSNCLSNKGLSIDYTKGEKIGWVVWACTDNDLNKNTKLQLTCYSMTVEASDTGNIDIDTPDNKKILGGIYVIPVNTDIGEMEFRISGIMVEIAGKWNIRFPFIGKENISKLKKQPKDIEKTEGSNQDSLTPVDNRHPTKSPQDKKSKKKKKK